MCDGLTGVARLSRQRFHRVECVDSGLGVSRWSWEHPLEPGGCSSHVSWIQDVVCCWPYPCAGKNASAENRTRVTSMAAMYSTTGPLILLDSIRAGQSMQLGSSRICETCISKVLLEIKIIRVPSNALEEKVSAVNRLEPDIMRI